MTKNRESFIIPIMNIEKTWNRELQEEFDKPYIKQLNDFLERERSEYVIYPDKDLVFSAFLQTPFDEIKVVIVGQDPYHGFGQAHGLSFSVPSGVRIPPSLKNIYRELAQDLEIPLATDGCLLPWAKQGVFLLNSILTVRDGEPKSHHSQGWEKFTDVVIEKLLTRKDPIVFLLWGKSAQEKGVRILSSTHHKVFMAAHPSPYSAKGFFGCRHFSKANECLLAWGKKTIDWHLPKDIL